MLDNKVYIEMRNKVCTPIHYRLCKHGCTQELINDSKKDVTTNEYGNITILYDQPIISDRNAQANRKDIAIKGIDFCYTSVSKTRDSIIAKAAEKNTMYQSQPTTSYSRYRKQQHLEKFIY